MPSPANVCQICGWLIEEERLEAIPNTGMCAVHAHAIGRYGGEFIVRNARVPTLRAREPLGFGVTSLNKRRNVEGITELQRAYFKTRDTRLTQFNPVLPEWRTSTVCALGKALVETGNPDALPVLADALEEAGCDDPRLLKFCRAPERWFNAAGVLGWLSGALSLVNDDDDEIEREEEVDVEPDADD